MSKKKIKIGLDFDGVVAYNPLRIIRAPISFVKKRLLGVKRLTFYVPHSSPERLLWTILHESSFFPAPGCGMLREIAKRDDLEFHLVTARFHFLQRSVDRWLSRYRMSHVFAGVHLNVHDQQPHIHKLTTINKLGLDYYVEDNWDIVSYITGKTPTQIFWIYNITDRGYDYPHKYPFLLRALQDMNL